MPLLTLLLCSIMESIALLLKILIPLIDLIYCVVLGRAAQFLPFYFLLVTELLSLSIFQNQELEGISVLGREMKISQLADDTTLSKCEIMPVHDLNNDSIENIPIKSTVKYLGIYITKNLLARQHFNFSSRIVKSKNILNSWLQRDLSLYGRVLLSKAEGLSHFVYPSLSLFVENKVA